MSPPIEIPADKLLFNQGEVAAITRISRHLVKVSIKNGSLPTRMVGGMRYVTRASLQRFIERIYGDEEDDPPAASARQFHQAMRSAR